MAFFSMTSQASFILTALFYFLIASAQKTTRHVVVTGSVFYDRCKDGRQDPYDYAVEGAKVIVRCVFSDQAGIAEANVSSASSGEYIVMFNNFKVRCCGAWLSGSGINFLTCGAFEGAASRCNRARLSSRWTNAEVHLMSPLLIQPAIRNPSYCRIPTLPKQQTQTERNLTACSHEMWARKDNICHWNMVKPTTKVADVFGRNSARRYGTEMNLWQGLQGKEELYQTLLREAIATLLNAYHSTNFPYSPKDVIYRMNFTLADSLDQAIQTSQGFQEVNNHYGYGCDLTPCI